MKIIKYLSLERPLQPSRKCGSVAGSIISSVTQSDINSSQMYNQREQNQLSRDYTTQMYERQVKDAILAEERANAEWDRRLESQVSSDIAKQRSLNQVEKELQDWIFKNYQSPQAQVKALRAAGLNPAMLLGGGSGFAGGQISAPSSSVGGTSFAAPQIGSVPSGTSAPQIGMPSLGNPGAAFENAFVNMTQAFKNISDSKKTGAEAYRLEATQESYINGMLAEQSLKETAAASANFHYGLEKENLPKKIENELKLLESDARLKIIQGDYERAHASYSKALERIASYEGDIGKEKASRISALLDLEIQSGKQEIAFKKAAEKAQNAAADNSFAGAEKLRAETKTENEFRILRSELLKVQNKNEESKNKVLQNQIRILKTKLTESEIQARLASIEERDKTSYSALHRLFFGKPERGDFEKALKFFTASGSEFEPFE